MRQLRYTRYKDSEVQWLGRIPAHWNIMRLKFAATHNDEALPEETDPDYEIEYVDISSVDLVAGIQKTDRMPFEKAPSRARRKARDGDTIISTVRTYLKAITTVNNPPENLIVSTGFAVVRPGPNILPRYLGYYTKSQGFVDAVVANSFGVSYPAINASELVRLPIVYPPLDEQRAIVCFLDAKTGQIDELIAKKERLLRLVDEKRMAVVTEAVTRGLSRDASMTDTGIAWLGRLPDGWATRRVRQLCGYVTSGSRGWAKYYEDDGPIFLRIGNISGPGIELDLSTIQHVTPPNDVEGRRTRVQSGDILVSITALIGAVAVVPNGLGEAYVNQHLALVRPTASNILPTWIALCLASSLGQEQFQARLYGGTKDGLNLNDIRDIFVPVPDIEQQRTIIEHVSWQLRKIAEATRRIDSAIHKLMEYRSATITSAVTGQIDVRACQLWDAAQ